MTSVEKKSSIHTNDSIQIKADLALAQNGYKSEQIFLGFWSFDHRINAIKQLLMTTNCTVQKTSLPNCVPLIVCDFYYLIIVCCTQQSGTVDEPHYSDIRFVCVHFHQASGTRTNREALQLLVRVGLPNSNQWISINFVYVKTLNWTLQRQSLGFALSVLYLWSAHMLLLKNIAVNIRCGPVWMMKKPQHHSGLSKEENFIHFQERWVQNC